jgi:hypothetical protein
MGMARCSWKDWAISKSSSGPNASSELVDHLLENPSSNTHLWCPRPRPARSESVQRADVALIADVLVPTFAVVVEPVAALRRNETTARCFLSGWKTVSRSFQQPRSSSSSIDDHLEQGRNHHRLYRNPSVCSRSLLSLVPCLKPACAPPPLWSPHQGEYVSTRFGVSACGLPGRSFEDRS